MKGLAGLGAAALIAGAVVLWFMAGPAVVTMEVRPLTPNAALPSFKHVSNDPQFAAVPRPAR